MRTLRSAWHGLVSGALATALVGHAAALQQQQIEDEGWIPTRRIELDQEPPMLSRAIQNRPQRPCSTAGRIEATDSTFWFKFKDDIVIRLRPESSGVRIDARSVSRVGKGDVGINAIRLRKFFELL